MTTESQLRALKIIQEYNDGTKQPIRPAEFSRLMWPDSDGHKRSCKGVRGSGMWIAAGGYLGKLRKQELVKQVVSRPVYKPRLAGYTLTLKGKIELAKHMDNNKD